MDYGKVIGRAWEITWRWKVLWVFGFLVGLGQGDSGGGSNFRWVEDRGYSFGFVERIPPGVVGLLVALVCVGLLVGIALWVLSVIGRGALIGGVQQVEEEGSTDLGRAWGVGVRRFWTLFGISVLTGLPIFILALLTVAAFVGPILTDIGISAGRREPTGIFALSCLCGAPICCATIMVAIILSQIRMYADRAAVLESLGWMDAFQRGWQVLRENIGPTVVFWLVFFVIGLVFAVVVGGGLLALISPFVVFLNQTEPGVWMLIPICGGGLLFMVIGALVGSVVQTFTSATWTLAYREMAGLSTQPTDLESVVG